MYLPTYLLSTKITYLSTYRCTYLPTYWFAYYLLTFQPIYQVKYLLIYLWKRLKFKCCYTHLQKIHWSSRKHVEFIWYHFFYRVVWCLMANTFVWSKETKAQFTLPTYIMEYVYSYILVGACAFRTLWSPPATFSFLFFLIY
jgi:hypothetical protein